VKRQTSSESVVGFWRKGSQRAGERERVVIADRFVED
jgi:hypothetical protein